VRFVGVFASATIDEAVAQARLLFIDGVEVELESAVRDCLPARSPYLGVPDLPVPAWRVELSVRPSRSLHDHERGSALGARRDDTDDGEALATPGVDALHEHVDGVGFVERPLDEHELETVVPHGPPPGGDGARNVDASEVSA